MQEEVKDGTATAVEPKKEVVESDHDYEATHLSSKQDEEKIVLQSPSQTEDINSAEEQLNKEKENINNHIASELSCENQEKVVNKEPEVIINVDLQAVVSDTSIPTVEIPNCDVKQLVVVETNNQLNLLEEEHCNIQGNEGNNESLEKEKETNGILQEDPIISEINAVLEEQPELENKKEVGDFETQIELIDDSPEFVIIDIADYDPEIPTTDDDINLTLEDVKEITNETAKNEMTNKSPQIKPLNAKQRKLLKTLEWKIIKFNLNLNKLPPDIWELLQQFTWSQRRLFLNNIKKKLADRNKQNEGPSKQPQRGNNKKQDMINDLTSSISRWLSEKWSTIEGNIKSGEKWEINSNTKQRFPEKRKHEFMNYIDQMIDCGMVNINKLPPELWNCMKQLPSKEKKKFLQAMREKQEKRSSGGPASSFIPLSNSSSKRDFREINQASRSQSRAATWRKSNENPDSKNKLYSFDRDFHNQRLGKSSIATTSTVSPNIFSQSYFNYQETNMSRNNAYNSQSSYRSFNDSFQTPNMDIAASWSSYDRDRASGPSYSNSGNYQALSHYSGGVSRSENGSSSYNNPSKRKLPDFSSHNQPQQKRPNKKLDKSPNKPSNESIKAIIKDENTPRGKMNAEHAAIVSSELLRLIDEASSSATGYIPRFNNSGLYGGMFRINCADQKSFDWLSAMVSTLPELWNGAKLCVTTKVPNSKRVQVTLFVASGSGEEKADTIMQRLEKQNPGLTTGNWKVYRQTKNARGQVFFIDIDELSESVLKTMNYKAFLGLSSVKFQIDQTKKNNY